MQPTSEFIGLTPETANVFEDISKLSCISDLYLCGGTGISLQLGHRLSEDLDFELIGTKRIEEPLNFGKIMDEIFGKFDGVNRELLGHDQFLLHLPNNVKLSFFKPNGTLPSLGLGYVHNNLKTPSLQDLLGMKLYVTCKRSTFRDLYDIYSLVEAGCDIKQGIEYASKMSNHSIHTKNIVCSLTSYNLYGKDSNFDARLQPKYSLTSMDICRYMQKKILSENIVSRQFFGIEEEPQLQERKKGIHW